MSKKLIKDNELTKNSGGKFGKDEIISLSSGLACLGAFTLCENISYKKYKKSRSGFTPSLSGILRPLAYAVGTIASAGLALTVYTGLTENKNKDGIF